MTSVTSYTSAGVVTQTVTYTYDALGRQVSETIAVAGGATTTTKFIYDGQAIVATLDGTNALTNRYLDGPMVDQVFADEQFDSTEAGELPTAAGIVLYPLVDNQGTARDLVEYDATTATTTIVNHIAYTAFGAVTSQTDTTINYLFGYTGFVHDTATGLDKSMTRYYDAVDGLWTQEDPIGFAGGQINLSKYVGNGPTNGVDPGGHTETINVPGGGSVHIDGETMGTALPHVQYKDTKIRIPANITDVEDLTSLPGINKSLIKRVLKNPETRRKLQNQLNNARAKCGLAGIVIAVALAVPEIAEGAEKDGVSGAASAAGDAGTGAVVSYGTSVAVGGTIMGGASVAGTSVTTGAGVAYVGVGGAAAVGGAAMAAGGVGLGIGYGIGSIHVGRETIHEHLGNGMYYVASGVYSGVSTAWVWITEW